MDLDAKKLIPANCRYPQGYVECLPKEAQALAIGGMPNRLIGPGSDQNCKTFYCQPCRDDKGYQTCLYSGLDQQTCDNNFCRPYSVDDTTRGKKF